MAECSDLLHIGKRSEYDLDLQQCCDRAEILENQLASKMMENYCQSYVAKILGFE